MGFELLVEGEPAYYGSYGYYSDVVDGEEQGGVNGLHGEHKGVGAEVVDGTQGYASDDVSGEDGGTFAVMVFPEEGVGAEEHGYEEDGCCDYGELAVDGLFGEAGGGVGNGYAVLEDLEEGVAHTEHEEDGDGGNDVQQGVFMTALGLVGPDGEGHGYEDETDKEPFGLCAAFDEHVGDYDGNDHGGTAADCGYGYAYASGGGGEHDHTGHEDEAEDDDGTEPGCFQGVDRRAAVQGEEYSQNEGGEVVEEDGLVRIDVFPVEDFEYDGEHSGEYGRYDEEDYASYCHSSFIGFGDSLVS